jgi:hypothetical protein
VEEGGLPGRWTKDGPSNRLFLARVATVVQLAIELVDVGLVAGDDGFAWGEIHRELVVRRPCWDDPATDRLVVARQPSGKASLVDDFPAGTAILATRVSFRICGIVRVVLDARRFHSPRASGEESRERQGAHAGSQSVAHLAPPCLSLLL